MAKQIKVEVGDAGAKPVDGRELIARGPLTISGKYKDTKQDFGPIEGYEIQVTYASVAEALRYAFNSTRIIVQAEIRDAIANRTKPYIQPGVLAKVNAQGRRALSQAEKNAVAIEAMLSNPTALKDATLEQRQKIAEMLGLTLPEEPTLEESASQEEPDQSEDEEVSEESSDDASDDDFAGYDEDELRKLDRRKLNVLAKQHEMEGYEELDRDELIAELVAL